MRIAFIVGPFPELSKTFVLNQITGLIDLGHEVEIFAVCGEKGPMHSDVVKYGLMEKTHCIPKSKAKGVAKAAYLIARNFHRSPLRILKSLNVFSYGLSALSLRLFYTVVFSLDKKFDIIQCHFGHNGNLGACLKDTGFEGKLVTMFHGYGIRLGEEKGGEFYRRLFEKGDCFLAISDYNRRKLIQFGADPKKIVFHPVGIDVKRFPYRQAKQTETTVILTVARLTKEKGLEYGIEAVNRVMKDNPNTNIEYRIVGEGRLEKRLKGLVKSLCLKESVHFLGPMPQKRVAKEMQKAHIFLLPSLAEALPVSLMEAQCTGLPIVATSVGAVSEEVVENKSGFLVATGNANALAEKLNYLIKHPKDWAKIGKIGHKLVRERYDINKLNPQLARIYETLLLEKRA